MLQKVLKNGHSCQEKIFAVTIVTSVTSNRQTLNLHALHRPSGLASNAIVPAPISTASTFGARKQV